MPYDFRSLEEYLSRDTSPAEVIQTLRQSKYDLVKELADASELPYWADRYLNLLLLEDEFLKLDPSLAKIQMRWT